MTGYPLPKGQLVEVAMSALMLRPRSFAIEAQHAVATLRPPLICEGLEHIPERGPFLAVHNHYNAPGYAAWWNVLAISAAIAKCRAPEADLEVHWVMTSGWRGVDETWRNLAIMKGTAWLFARVALIYGFINMRPMPPRPEEAVERASSVLRTVRLARQLSRTGGMIGLTPEGQDNPGGFGHPPPGAGEFMALLVEAGLPILPAGNGQTDGHLRVRFGPVFAPHVPPRRENRDAVVADQVMGAIARCLQ